MKFNLNVSKKKNNTNNIRQNYSNKLILNLELEMESDYISLESVNQLVELYAVNI